MIYSVNIDISLNSTNQLVSVMAMFCVFRTELYGLIS
jgi:hypothetical protein